MKKNKFNLRNVVAVAICLVGLMAFVGCENKVNYEYEDPIENCENKDNSAEGNDIVGKWVVADNDHNHIEDGGFIIFTEDFGFKQSFFGFLAITLLTLFQKMKLQLFLTIVVQVEGLIILLGIS